MIRAALFLPLSLALGLPFAGCATSPLPPPTWEATVQPVFHRACEGCHRADGRAGIPLATREDWKKRRVLIRERVLVRGDMPPFGCAISAEDVEAIRRWVEK